MDENEHKDELLAEQDGIIASADNVSPEYQSMDADEVTDVVEHQRVTLANLEGDAATHALTWHQHLGGNALTPNAEHDVLEAIGTDVTLLDTIVVETLHPWLSKHIDGVMDSGLGPEETVERIEDMLGRCRNNTPEKATCEALLFTARLGVQMERSGQDYMTALQWMGADDVKMLIEAGSYATQEIQTYIDVLVQSVAVTKVTR